MVHTHHMHVPSSVPKASDISFISLLANSFPRSDQIIFGFSNLDIQQEKTFSTAILIQATYEAETQIQRI